MILWLFFIGDLLSIIAIFGMHVNLITGVKFPLFCILYLGIKGLLFIKNFMSMIDLAIAIYMILMLAFDVSGIFSFISIAFLSYKLLMTILMR